MASASVPVARVDGEIVYGIDAASAASTKQSKSAGWRVDPRPIDGPDPNAASPIVFGSTPGCVVSKVTSTTIATSGSSENAVVAAPARVISSCTAATAATGPGAPPASATSRATSRAV